MRLVSSLSAVLSQAIVTFISFCKVSRLRRQSVALALIVSLLVLPTPSLAYTGLSDMASLAWDAARLPARYAAPFISWLFSSKPKAQQPDSLADRLNSVSRLHLFPYKLVAYAGESATFSALPFDSLNRAVQGVRLSWESPNADIIQIDDSGQAHFLQAGLARVVCRAGFASGTAVVLIRAGQRPPQTDLEWRADQAALTRALIDSTTSTSSSGTASLLPSLLDRLMPTAEAQSTGGYFGTDFPYDELWSQPRNLVGSPRNAIVEPTKIGGVLPESSSFNMSIPMVSLSGRGLGVNLSLNYNSRVWSRHNSAVTFDAAQGWPSPGFSLGFGRIITYGPSNQLKYLLVDLNGTRRYLGVGGNAAQTVTLTTQDGTHITYVGNGSSGTLFYPDGTQASVALANNRLVVTQITDPNGNYISITYHGVEWDNTCGCFVNWPPLSVDHVTDSLGRIIQFNYDAGQNLTSITAPGLGGTVQNPVYQTVAQFDYESRTPSTSFSGLTVENIPQGQNGPAAVNFIKHVYFPATNTGVKFSYTAFCSAYNVSTRRQMSINQSGVISDGVENASATFNYQQAATPALTDAPAFTQRTESPGSANPFVYSQLALNTLGPNTQTFVITPPDASTNSSYPVTYLTRSTDTASVANGRLVQAEVKNYSGTSFSKAVYAYANDPGGSPQVQSVISSDDATPTPNQVKVDFDYDSYGNVTNKREYGFQVGGVWSVQRRTNFTYKTDAAYVNAYLRSLVTQILVLDGSSNTVAKATKTYDDYTAMGGGMENYGGTAAPPGHLASYDTTKTVRGNVTGTTEWSDIAGNVSTTRNNQRDIFGNVVKAQVSCCNEKSFTYTATTYWSAPDSVTDGPATGLHLTSTATYDFDTGVTQSTTDPNAQTATFSYDAALRNTATTIPTGASGGVSYTDSTLTSARNRTYDEDGVHKTISTSFTHDGWGQTTVIVNPHHGQFNTSYDAMGRVLSVTNPFMAGGTPSSYVTSYQYDPLGRITVVTLPGGNTVQTAYSGATVTITDQVGRKIKRENDGLGRLIKVTEQDGGGALTQETTYTYNLLNKLTSVNQGNQTRSYQYDALGRLIYETIPEQTPKTGTTFTTKYTYTDFDAVATKTDARGVVTTYTYDTLNRLTNVSYDISGATCTPNCVASTPSVTYTYDTNQSSSTVGLLLSVSVGSTYQESYSYDSFMGVSAITYTIDGKTYTVNYGYNAIGQKNQIGQIYFQFDNMGHVAAVRNFPAGGNGTSFLSNATYDLNGLLASDSLANGVNETFGYDSQRLYMNSHIATKGATTLMSLSYSNNATTAGQFGALTTAGNADQVMSISGTINSTTESAAYTYDLQGRLTTANQTTNGTSAQRRFVYDRWGNRTAVYDAASGGNLLQSVSLVQSSSVPTNQIASVTQGGTTLNYSYDNNGNVINDGAHTYTYDAENRIVSVDSGATAQYGYDTHHRRVKKVSGGATRHYVSEGDQVLAEYNGTTGAVLTQYFYLQSRLVAKVEGTPSYFLGDKLSARVVLDGSGNVVGRQATLPFGEEVGGSGTPDKHHFTSYESDTESGNDYAMNRGYSPSTGRFNQADPFVPSADASVPQSWNRYAYTLNDPVNFIDPSGLQRVGSALYYDPCSPGPDPGGGGGQKNLVLCPEQDFQIPVNAFTRGRFTDEELRALVSTAVGESSYSIFNADEVQAVIAEAINRQSYNLAWQAHHTGHTPHFPNPKNKRGDPAPTDIRAILLQGFVAARNDAGWRKIEERDTYNFKHFGVYALLADDVACKELVTAKAFALSANYMSRAEIFARYPFTFNFGSGGQPYTPPGEYTNLTVYGYTTFWNVNWGPPEFSVIDD